MKTTFILFLCYLILIIPFNNIYPVVRYAHGTDGNGGNGGTSWTDAYDKLDSIFGAYACTDDTIIVKDIDDRIYPESNDTKFTLIDSLTWDAIQSDDYDSTTTDSTQMWSFNWNRTAVANGPIIDLSRSDGFCKLVGISFVENVSYFMNIRNNGATTILKAENCFLNCTSASVDEMIFTNGDASLGKYYFNYCVVHPSGANSTAAFFTVTIGCATSDPYFYINHCTFTGYYTNRLFDIGQNAVHVTLSVQNSIIQVKCAATIGSYTAAGRSNADFDYITDYNYWWSVDSTTASMEPWVFEGVECSWSDHVDSAQVYYGTNCVHSDYDSTIFINSTEGGMSVIDENSSAWQSASDGTNIGFWNEGTETGKVMINRW